MIDQSRPPPRCMECSAPIITARQAAMLSDADYVWITSPDWTQMCRSCFIRHEETWIARLDEGIAETLRELETDPDPILRKFLRLQESTRAGWAADLEKMRAEEDRKRREKLEEAGILALLQSPEQKS